MTKRPYRPYHNMYHLLRIYRFIEAYEQERKCAPSYTEIVEQGLAPSTSIVRFYFVHMEQMGMLTFQKGIARSCRILPLDVHNSYIKQALEKEKLIKKAEKENKS